MRDKRIYLLNIPFILSLSLTVTVQGVWMCIPQSAVFPR